MQVTPAEDSKPAPVAFGVFGTYRFALALMVVATHVLPSRMAYLGTYAVFAFFVLSGYVVSYILRYSYLPRQNGLAKYALNRMLRIYPPYWVVCALFVWLISRFPEQSQDILPCGYIIGKPLAAELGWWFLMLTLLAAAIPLVSNIFRPLLIPPAMSVGIEVGYWILIPIMLKRPGFRKTMLIFALGYTLFTTWFTVHIGPQQNLFYIQQLRFYISLAGALPFCFGLRLLLLKAEAPVSLSHTIGIGAMVSFMALLCAARIYGDPYFFPFYVSLILNVVIILYLSQFEVKDMPAWFGKMDAFMGNLSYPLFILHFPVEVALHCFFPSLPLRTMTCFFYTLAASIPLSALLHFAVEGPMDRIKHLVKRR